MNRRVDYLILGLLAVAAGFLPILAYLLPSEVAGLVQSGWTTPGLSASEDLSHDMVFHILTTAGRAEVILMGGIVVSAALVGLSMSLGLHHGVSFLTLLSAIPPLVWVPLSLSCFGLNPVAFDAPAALFVATMLAPGAVRALRSPPTSAETALRLGGFGPFDLWTRLYLPWLVYRLGGQLCLSIALLFGMCAVVEYMSGTHGVGAVLKLITGYSEERQIAALTLASIATIALIQLLVWSGLKCLLKSV